MAPVASACPRSDTATAFLMAPFACSGTIAKTSARTSRWIEVASATNSSTVVVPIPSPWAISEISTPNAFSAAKSSKSSSNPSMSFSSAFSLALFNLPSAAAKLISIALSGFSVAKARSALPCPLIDTTLALPMASLASSGTMSITSSKTSRCIEVATATNSDTSGKSRPSPLVSIFCITIAMAPSYPLMAMFTFSGFPFSTRAAISSRRELAKVRYSSALAASLVVSTKRACSVPSFTGYKASPGRLSCEA